MRDQIDGGNRRQAGAETLSAHAALRTLCVQLNSLQFAKTELAVLAGYADEQWRLLHALARGTHPPTPDAPPPPVTSLHGEAISVVDGTIDEVCMLVGGLVVSCPPGPHPHPRPHPHPHPQLDPQPTPPLTLRYACLWGPRWCLFTFATSF